LVNSAHQLIRSAASQTRLGSDAERSVDDIDSRSAINASRRVRSSASAALTATLIIRLKSRIV
jgi:hypothetical protein